LGIHGNMPLNARHFLASVVAFLFGGVSILDALGVNDAKTRAPDPTIAGTDLAN
jgi:hypothetical protein